jgi:hypothetical protein
LAVFLEIGKSQLQVGEPVYATIRLINRSSAPVKVHRNVALHTGTVQIAIASQAGTPSIFQPLSQSFDVAPSLELTPGMETNTTSPLFYGAKGWTVTQRPGTYVLRALYRPPRQDDRATIQSEPVTVIVSRGDGAGEFLMEGKAGKEAARFLLWLGGDHLKDGIGRLHSLIGQYPHSVLADYANFALGRSLSREFKDFSRNAVRPPDYQRALEHFSKVRIENLPPYLRIMTLTEQARSLIGIGQYEEGQRLVREAKAITGEEPKWENLLKQVHQVESQATKMP